MYNAVRSVTFDNFLWAFDLHSSCELNVNELKVANLLGWANLTTPAADHSMIRHRRPLQIGMIGHFSNQKVPLNISEAAADVSGKPIWMECGLRGDISSDSERCIYKSSFEDQSTEPARTSRLQVSAGRIPFFHEQLCTCHPVLKRMNDSRLMHTNLCYRLELPRF